MNDFNIYPQFKIMSLICKYFKNRIVFLLPYPNLHKYKSPAIIQVIKDLFQYFRVIFAYSVIFSYIRSNWKCVFFLMMFEPIFSPQNNFQSKIFILDELVLIFFSMTYCFGWKIQQIQFHPSSFQRRWQLPSPARSRMVCLLPFQSFLDLDP